MRRVIVVLLLWGNPVVVLAFNWTFGDKIPITTAQGERIYHHLESSGRKNIAVAGTTVAVAWEDNRSGTPQVYVAVKEAVSGRFDADRKINAGGTAFDPSIVALSAGRFLVGWEQDGVLWARVVTRPTLGPAVQLDGPAAAQIAFASASDEQIIAVWTRLDSGFRRVVTAIIDVASETKIRIGRAAPVDAEPPKNDQLYPTVAVTKRGTTIAWEDRRRGHTAILYSHTGATKNFSAPKLLNEPAQKSDKYGRGSGVTRVALAADGANSVCAAWMDKRGFRTGYDIYAAQSQDGGMTFGANQLVQDGFGESFSQWHPAIAADSRGNIVVAWDDDRDETSDVWLTARTGDRWHENHAPAAASGKGQQTNPTIAIDAQGNLHLAWIEQQIENGPSKLFYVYGRKDK